MNHLEDAVKLIDFHPDGSWQHVLIRDPERCRECREKTCLTVCPSSVFRWNCVPADPVLVFYRQCIECGSCRLVCPAANIDFSYPHGGFGVMFRDG